MVCKRCKLDLPRPHNRRTCNFPPSGVQFPDSPPEGKPVIVADWESGKWNVVEFGTEGDLHHYTIPNRDALLNGELWSEREVLLVVESAHVSPRSNPPQNKSQIFSREELQELAVSLELSNSKLIAFPQSLTKQARAFTGIPDALKDECDPWAILAFYLYFTEEIEFRKIGFSNWKPLEDREIALRMLANSVREDMTFRLNTFRSIHTHDDSPPDYDTSFLPIDEVQLAVDIAAEIRDNHDLSDEAKVYFGLDADDLNESLYGTPRAIRLMSLYVCVFNSDGTIRTHQTMIDDIPDRNIQQFELFEGTYFPLQISDTPIGMKFIWDRLLKMHPYRGKSSGAGQLTARANLMWKGLRFYDQENIESHLYLLKGCPGCGANPGNECVASTGDPTNIHAKRKMVSWNEPNELWTHRRTNRKNWRKIQKEMLKKLIQVGIDLRQQGIDQN